MITISISLDKHVALLRHFRHALPIEVDLADAFDPAQHIINGLTADAD
jgi:hypothetical protein